MLRKTTPDDIYRIVEIARNFHTEGNFGYAPLNENKIIDIVEKSETNSSRYFTKISENDGFIDGIVMGFISTYWFSDALGAFDYCLYVVPKKRGSDLAVKLWDAFRDWAYYHGAQEITHGVSTGINIDRAHRFFTSMGMRHVGGLYTLPLSQPNPLT